MKMRIITRFIMLTVTAGFTILSTDTFCSDVKPLGVKINVMNMSIAYDFYVGKLGFSVKSGNRNSKMVILEPANRKEIVILKEVANLLEDRTTDAKAGITLQVNNIDSTIQKLKVKVINFSNETLRKEGVGYAIFIYDPFKTRISLMQVTITSVARFAEPQIYNYGYRVPDMDKARAFYKTFGFIEKTEKYLPLDMPLYNSDGAFAFMLHYREDVVLVMQNSADNQHVVIVFKTSDLEHALTKLSGNVKFIQKTPTSSELGKSISFRDPGGYISELVELSK